MSGVFRKNKIIKRTIRNIRSLVTTELRRLVFVPDIFTRVSYNFLTFFRG